MNSEKINKYNKLIMERLSFYLNFNANFIKKSMIDELVNDFKLDKKEAFSLLLAEACNLDIGDNLEHRQLYENYFPYMINQLDRDKYENNLYYKNIKIENIKNKQWQFRSQKYEAYEAFVFNDLNKMSDGRLIPQIGFFDEEFAYPAILENNREWMLITPNEIETMELPIERAKGSVLTYGLGMGYYAYMVSQSSEVSSITIVERDKEVIDLFEQYILPQFNYKNKIKIINEDAFVYAQNHMQKENYDFVFVDIWHDPSDGIDMYLKMKEYEKENLNSEFMYWIEKTMKCYLD